jgi:ribonuclease-3
LVGITRLRYSKNLKRNSLKRILKSFRSKSPYSDKKLRSLFKKYFGFSPRDVSVYREALRHKSADSVRITGLSASNERLEYLGDAILGAIIAQYLFTIYPNQDEGFLTKMRSKLVSRTNLNKLATILDLQLVIEENLNPTSVKRSLLGNALEALIGALYLQKGYSKTYKLVVALFQKQFDLKLVESEETDYKSKLLIWAQRERKNIQFVFNPEGEITADQQYEVTLLIEEEEEGKASATSKKKAEQLVSQLYCQKNLLTQI